MKIRNLAISLATLSLAACGQQAKQADVSFSAQVKPLLEQHCVECHKAGGEGYQKSGLLLTSYETLMAGTKFGPVVKPGSAISSSLYLVISGQTDPSIRMPHNRDPIPGDAIETIKQWIDQGAKNN